MTVTIAARFNGPPGSGHGGYSAGLAAALVDAPAAEVTLRRPPPLDTPLELERADGDVHVCHAGAVVLAARAIAPGDGAGDVPAAPVSLAEAAAASERFAWRDEGHPFPTCFGCGPERGEDALRLFCGPVGDGRFAVPWTPPPWAGEDGVVTPLFLWAALDCPSSAPVHGSVSGPVVLGRLSVAAGDRPARLGEPHVIQSWLERAEGRRRFTGVALRDADGAVLASGRAVWFELARPPAT